ncbi:hypothetical protein GALMADRAFT_818177 [Galerina marginata CBS 339.88]|uniref:Uncharacterized protein n=1 Tax=Galerina marginata (strain CBS 339.88) TaxID=685588 RepID=A0A067TJ37_GALM3|nr:hypothetical protein GALMADRAFT_818177 [Galerina marginata CBS 339.88]
MRDVGRKWEENKGMNHQVSHKNDRCRPTNPPRSTLQPLGIPRCPPHDKHTQGTSKKLTPRRATNQHHPHCSAGQLLRTHICRHVTARTRDGG